MQQFIRYLYECDEEKRIRNLGFVKVEKQNDQYSIHIHGKGIDFGEEGRIEILVVCKEEDRKVAYSQGFVESNVPLIHSILRFTKDDVGGAESFSCVYAILLKNAKNVCYLSTWDDKPLPLSEIVQSSDLQVEEVEEEVEIEMQQDYIPPHNRTYEKIKRQDIARLPRKEWRLANNSFLLHGFYNYHHLLYITEEEHTWLGVPGIYHEKEAQAAKAFGFPQFHRITDVELELLPEETNTVEDFGYWCRVV